jgi:hypothetical protein
LADFPASIDPKSTLGDRSPFAVGEGSISIHLVHRALAEI